MYFCSESDFEEALIAHLFENGWERKVLKYKTEKDLIKNWADILFENNRDIDRLNDCPLTDGEMAQIIQQIALLRTPLKLNSFINGKTVPITRDNVDDTLHFGKEISLKIYDRQEIAAGQSRYQIAQQPIFTAKSKMLNDRRGDLMLLINGMPLIHIELKRSGVHVSQAYNQIEKYAYEGVFTGLFSLIQVFVAMEPNETVYFANPGPDGKFNKDYYFHWADFNNEPINDWDKIASSLLSIPMAHQLIGFYTVADDNDGVLKVMRSYQYYAVHAISDKVATIQWGEKNIYGGYIWHTTGSGKTMTSFKAAQLIANSKDADKVVFLMDRIELGTQSLLDYRGFADENEEIQSTENTSVLLSKLKSDAPANTLIVTSIQKMSNIKEEGAFNECDIKKINEKRIVFIIDEAHRSTFGEMLRTIKLTFPLGIFFGFTGTPIQDENQKKMNTTSTIFGDELHRYSIADGIRDKNVLGFDPYKVCTYSDDDLRNVVAKSKAKAKDIKDVFSDPQKQEIYYKYINNVPMAGYETIDGKYEKGIEDYINSSQYKKPKHQKSVVTDIINKWSILSKNGKFHAIFATSSIPEAIQYYKLFKSKAPNLKVVTLFEQSIDNSDKAKIKEEAIIEILTDYNKRYEQDFTIPTFQKYKKDVALRLAHKKPYLTIETTPEQQIDLLIVVDQMLTGFDSKWINTLYLDKVLRNEQIIQAFSRTNRLFGSDKPFGTIRYYRKPHTMEKYIEKAFKLYSGDKPLALFAEKLPDNLKKMNELFDEISDIFTRAKIKNFSKIDPLDDTEKAKFAVLFKDLNAYLEASKIQGFTWKKSEYMFEVNKVTLTINMNFDENTYLTLVLRYKEMFTVASKGLLSVPFELDSYITSINTGVIDSNYMNTKFTKYLKELHSGGTEEAINEALSDLHKSFATLSQEEQKYANIFLHDIERGNIKVEDGKVLKDYIVEYQARAKNDQIHRFADALGVNEEKLREFMKLKVTDVNINAFGRFDNLKDSVDTEKAKAYFEKIEKIAIPKHKVKMKIDKLLREFVLGGGFDI